jgi:TonB family protein
LASPDHNGDENPSRLGYFAAIFVSAIGHLAIFAFVFFIAPRFLHPAEAAPPAYTVKIVDSIPAGDLGTHRPLPRINRHTANESKAEASKPEESKIKTEPAKPEKLALNEDKNALKINAKATDAPTETPTPTPEATVAPTVEPTPEPTVEPKPLEPNLDATEAPTIAPTPEPTPQPTKTKRAVPKAKPTPEKARNRSKSGSTVARVASTPSVAQRMAQLKRKLFEEHVKQVAKNPPPDEEDDPDDMDMPDTGESGPRGGGPVVANIPPSEGKGYGIGTGEGSAGILKDPEFLLYYKAVQDQIKKAWTFTGGSNDLTATVSFAIGPDGALLGSKIGTSSNDGAFDDSVIRAIRRAAPFPAPPEKFRDEFSSGIEARFKLGELKS